MGKERPAAGPVRARVYDAAGLQRYADVEVRVRLSDGMTWRGWLRTDLLTERSVSVFIRSRGGQGATLYIDQIAEIVFVAAISAE